MQVFYNSIAAAVNEFDNIALSIAEIVVDVARAGAYLVNYLNKVARCVIGEALLDRRTAAAGHHIHEHGAIALVFGIYSVYHIVGDFVL